MAEIVLVHGTGQQLKSAASLEEHEWLPSLAQGLRKAGFEQVADGIWQEGHGRGGIDIRMAFYAHLFLKKGQQGDDPRQLTDEEMYLASALAEEWLERAATRSSRSSERSIAERELFAIRGELGVAQGSRAVARVVAQHLAKLHWFARFGMFFAEKFVGQSLAQVTQYFTDPEIRRSAQATVRSLIGRETKIVIGHSLGSVVAYESVQQLRQPLPLFVTIGSPLGLDTIIYSRLQPQPPGFPSAVRRWVNVADRDDFFAFEPNLTSLFAAGIPPEAVFEGGYTVVNGAEPHRAAFYLAQTEVGRPVGYVLSATR